MKKSKRTWFLISGVTALSAALLVPSVLSACSSETQPPHLETPEPEIRPNKLKEQLAELNKPENILARKNLYTSYFNAVNKPKNIKSKISISPDLESVNVTAFSEIVNKPDFFNQLIDMIKVGLDVGNQSSNGLISSDDLTQLIKDLEADKVLMTQQGSLPSGQDSSGTTVGSVWSSEAFEFVDSSVPTWSFISRDTNKIYKLFLTENVDFIFNSTPDKISVRVINKSESDKIKSRLVVKTKKQSQVRNNTKIQNLWESKTYNFKSDIYFLLPSLLFDDFSSYVETFDKNMDSLNGYLGTASDKYKPTDVQTDSGFAQAATLWNQFVNTHDEQILRSMKSDLNTKRTKSKIYSWIASNINVTNDPLLNDFKQDLEAAKTVDIDLDTLHIKGRTADHNGLNNLDNEEPDYTLIISFPDEDTSVQKNVTVPLDEKWYVLNLKATGFEFENQVNDSLFGYKDTSFVTNPKLTLDASKSGFASYKFKETGDVVNGNSLVTVEKISNTNLKNEVSNPTDVSNLYDINGTGFTAFLSDLVVNIKSGNTELTDKLIDVNVNSPQKAISSLKDYLKHDAQNGGAIGRRLLEQNVLADLILDNIDLSNQAMYTNPNETDSTKQVPDKSKKWRETLNKFVAGETNNESKIPSVTINLNPGDESSVPEQNSNNIQEVQRAKLMAHADISITANEGWLVWFNELASDARLSAYRGIYIFLGSSNNDGNTAIVSSQGNESTNLVVNRQNEESNNTQTSFDDFLNNVKQNFSIVFEANNNSGGGTTAKRMHGFYMGQEKKISSPKTGTAIPESNQISFPITLDSLIVNGNEFLNEFLFKADIPDGGNTQTPEVIVPPYRRVE